MIVLKDVILTFLIFGDYQFTTGFNIVVIQCIQGPGVLVIITTYLNTVDTHLRYSKSPFHELLWEHSGQEHIAKKILSNHQ